MTEIDNGFMIGNGFMDESRRFLREIFLPKIEQCVEQLTDEDIWWRANESSNSIGNLLLHLSGNVRQWIVSGLGGEEDQRVRQQEFDEREHLPKDQLIAKLRATVMEADKVLAEANAAQLLELRKIQGNDVSMIYAVYHVVEHFAMHTGQIILITKLRAENSINFNRMR